MKLNCKQGDLAIIVKSDAGNEGKIVAIGGNRRLDKRAQRLMGRARMRSRASGLSITIAQQGEPLQPFCGALISTSTPV